MKIKELIRGIKGIQVRPQTDVEVSGISANSKLVGPMSLFIAKKGKVFDGAAFIPEAIQNGAVAIATDVYDPTLKNVCQILYSDLAALELELSKRFYQNPSQELWMVGITGTCGKTTTSYAIQHILQKAEISSGLVGSIEHIVGKKRYNASYTTPDLSSNHKLLREMVRHGCAACVMEVSSHALDQRRVEMIEFDVCVFTNLTHEHLDYHKTMEEYFLAKRKLFDTLKVDKKSKKRFISKVALVNIDDKYAPRVIEACDPSVEVITYGIDKPADLEAFQIRYFMTKTEFRVAYKKKEVDFSWPLVGRYNVYNALSAIGVCLQKGLELEAISEYLKSFKPAPGRLEPVQNRLGVHIFVDFAHKPDALQNVLSSLRELSQKRIIVVFGCGGDRDREKRPEMGKIAQEYADCVIVTSDNPRSEDPHKIIKEIVGTISSKKVEIEVDRKKAIYKAIDMAEPQDVVIIAGRGHETKQLFAYLFLEFDDRKVAFDFADEIYHKKVLQMAGR